MGRSTIAPQRHQVLLPLWFKMRMLWMVLWEEESVGTVQQRDGDINLLRLRFQNSA